MVEMLMGMFEARSLRLGEQGGSGQLSREQIVGALGVVSGQHSLGWHAVHAEHVNDPEALAQLLAHLRTALAAHTAHCAQLPELALAVYLRRPLPCQLKGLIAKHPRWERERRRAAAIRIKAARAWKEGQEQEGRRLDALTQEVLSNARARCERELLETGRCPKCGGTGRMVRKGLECPTCHGTGKVIPSMMSIEQAHGIDARRAVDNAVDELGSAAKRFMRAMRVRIEGERAQ